MLNELKRITKSLDEETAKSLLFQILLRIEMLKETEYPDKEFTKDMKKIYDDFLSFTKREKVIQEDCEVVHIVFDDSSSGSLRVMQNEMGRLEMEKILSFGEIFSIGPVWNLAEEQGLDNRFKWLKNHIIYENGEIESAIIRFKELMLQINSIPAHVPIIIWTGDNSHEQTGLRFVLHLLKEKDNEVHEINSAVSYAELYKRPEIDYHPLHTGELAPEKLRSIYEKHAMANPLSHELRKRYEAEWEELSTTQKVLRIWKDGKIQSVEEDFYDDYIIDTCRKLHKKLRHKDFIKSARVIGSVIGHIEQYHGDAYFEYRVRHLIMNGTLEIEGVPKAMRFYSVKLR